MSEVSVAPDRFWREFKSDVAGTLSKEQRGEIERVVDVTSTAAAKEVSDLRLSFKWFFVRIAWGPEKRSAERVKQDQQTHPAMSRRNLPMLASLFAGYMAFWCLAVLLLTSGFVYYFSV